MSLGRLTTSSSTRSSYSIHAGQLTASCILDSTSKTGLDFSDHKLGTIEKTRERKREKETESQDPKDISRRSRRHVYKVLAKVPPW